MICEQWRPAKLALANAQSCCPDNICSLHLMFMLYVPAVHASFPQLGVVAQKFRCKYHFLTFSRARQLGSLQLLPSCWSCCPAPWAIRKARQSAELSFCGWHIWHIAPGGFACITLAGISWFNQCESLQDSCNTLWPHPGSNCWLHRHMFLHI